MTEMDATGSMSNASPSPEQARASPTPDAAQQLRSEVPVDPFLLPGRDPTDLVPEQRVALAQFRSLLASYYALDDSGRSDFQVQLDVARVDDAELLRFLRARTWNATAALDMYTAHQTWRHRLNIDRILEDDPTFQPQKLYLYKSLVQYSAHKHDKAGRPVTIEKMGALISSSFHELWNPEEFEHFHAWQQESKVRRCQELSKTLGRHVAQFCYIGDFAGLTLASRKGLWINKLISSMDHKNYPERAGMVFLINTPAFFPPLFRLVRPFLDENIQRRIVVTTGDPAPTLLQYIDADKLPEEYGGTCVCRSSEPKWHDQEGCLYQPDVATLNEYLGHSHLRCYTVRAGQQLDLRFASRPSGAVMEWFFTVDAHDIEFSASFIPRSASSPSSSAAAPDAIQVCVTPKRVRSDHEPENGRIDVDEDGEFALVWNNEYSKWRSKTVRLWTRRLYKPQELTSDRVPDS